MKFDWKITEKELPKKYIDVIAIHMDGHIYITHISSETVEIFKQRCICWSYLPSNEDVIDFAQSIRFSSTM